MGVAAIFITGSVHADARHDGDEHHHRHGAERDRFQVTRLVSDDTTIVPAASADPLLQNAWGLAAGPTSPWWVADNATASSTLYDAAGHKQSLEVAVPGAPTGLVFNGTSSFVVSDGAAVGPARFIFASEDGTISGWNPGVPPPSPSKQALVMVDNSESGAVYKGLAIASPPCGDRLYATDFHNNRVDVFDGDWMPVTLPDGAFEDDRLPDDYAPFGIRALGDLIIVTYAQQDADAHDDVSGHGHGFVDAYDPAGTLLVRVATRGRLDSPWGLAIAPPGFGSLGGALLVGNFGDGRIHAYDLERCHHHGCRELGPLRLPCDGGPVVIDRLWAIDFGKGNAQSGPTDSLYFTAGPNDETDGLFGFIAPVRRGR